MNHNIKSVNNALYKSKARGFSFLKGDVINYLKRCVSYAIAQNKNNVEGVRSAILNISKHTFGEHDGCGDWCKAKSDPNYVYKYLPNQQPFTCPEWRQELEELLQKQADDAPQLAPGGSTQPNESFNHMVNTRAPKSRHYAGTLANKMRVACAVNTKNIGSEHINIVFEKLKMSPSATEFRAKLERSRIWKRSYQKKDSVKRRRLFLKNKNTWRDYTASSQTGLTYVSGMSSVMERAASAASKVASVPCYLPPPSVLLPECKLVIVDIETTGFSSSDQIIQLAAKCEEKEFSAYILPTKKVHPKASEKTGFRLQGGKLRRHQHCMPTCEAGKACADVVDFLSLCANQVILVGHGIGSFDFPRILKLLRAKGLAKEFLALVYGLTNTIPLIQQGTVKKEDCLAKMYLKGPQWEKLVNGAHDALVDCILLDALLKHFAVGEVTLKEKVQPIHQLLQKQAALKKKMEHRPALLAMQTFGVSKIMIGKMAATGVTVEELQSEYQTHGRVGLEVCLGVQLAGKPRVTTNKSIIDCVEKYLQSV
ncbi:uncharacterized protein LOC117640412 [Thrips palmi]|uniref:Uncharacterized protein LOC117640412 n=1 Tax=Thrips palmi TaxID=161013 RepID=A0A6P8YFV3_THRPL|nr:uncharacterized protein LOC117640412 [Thrips palmi]